MGKVTLAPASWLPHGSTPVFFPSTSVISTPVFSPFWIFPLLSRLRLLAVSELLVTATNL